MIKYIKIMEHTNLFFYRDKADLEAAYPDGKVDVVPGVAYARGAAGENGTTLFNKKLVKYEVTLLLENKSGETVGDSESVLTKDVLEGQSIKLNIVAPEVENYKPRHEVEKIEVSADTEHTVIYLGKTAYTVTVHHVFDGEPIAPDTEIQIDDVWDESSVVVTIEPVSVAGYIAETHTLTVSGNCEYTLEYEETGGYGTIDLGLPSGTLWCSCNVGASSPEQYGDYFAWGETTPKESYVRDNYAWYNPSTGQYTKYSGGSDFNLEISDDAAASNMGGDWHMPSTTQINELTANCTFSLTTYNDVPGIEYTSNINGETLFFPGGKVVGENAEDITGSYFSSALTWSLCGGVNSKEAKGQCFDIYGGAPEVFNVDLFYGMPVRGVIGEGSESEQDPIVQEPEVPAL